MKNVYDKLYNITEGGERDTTVGHRVYYEHICRPDVPSDLGADKNFDILDDLFFKEPGHRA